MRNLTSVTWAAVAAATLWACAAPNPAQAPTLYDRIGGKPVVEKIANDLIDKTMSDPRTERSFKDVKIPRVKEKLAEQICFLSGGPCKYTGDPMKEVHKGLKVTEAEMSLMVQFLRDTLDNAGVGTAEKNELLRLLAPMKRDIVTQ